VTGEATANEATAYVALGSNLGDKKANLDRAVELLKATPGVRVSAVSNYIETAPVGYTDQPDFLNAVAELKTALSPEALLSRCMEIERALKRKRIIHWGPRTLDLDLLLYGDCIINEETLTLPHPRMQERGFVLGPLSEIAPDVVHPLLHKTAKELYDALPEDAK
jgi:2-amino-4-hydroxy-6-hydroxymethyldihydropteridine diphosphokinase